MIVLSKAIKNIAIKDVVVNSTIVVSGCFWNVSSLSGFSAPFSRTASDGGVVTPCCVESSETILFGGRLRIVNLNICVY
jgi:hypothetical protein